jgi:hypothetical protein
MPDTLATLCGPLLKLRGTNTTDTSFPSRIPQAAEPSGIGDAAAQTTSAVFDVGRLDSKAGVEVASEKNSIKIVPFGAGSDDTTFSMRVIGWQRAFKRSADRNDDLEGLWVPQTLAEFACTLCTSVGIAGRSAINTDRFVDTITLTGTSGNDDVDVSITSPADNTIGHVIIDLKAVQKVEITFDMTGATSGNAFVSMY